MNQVEQNVFKVLSQRRRINEETNIRLFTRYIKAIDHNVTEEDVLEVFKRLQADNKGVVVYGRKDNPDRFKWAYNLKDVAIEALGKTSMPKVDTAIPVEKKRRGRPAKSFKTVKPQAGTTITINLELGSKVSQKDIQALIELAKDLNDK